MTTSARALTPDEYGHTLPEGSTATWKDKKRYLWLWGLMVPGLGTGFALLYLQTGGWWGFALIGPVLVNVVIPLFDLAFGRDNSNPPDEVIAALENDKYYRWVVFLYIPLMYVVLLGGFAILMGHNPVTATLDFIGLGSWADANLGGVYDNTDLPTDWWLSALWAFSLAAIVGIGINTAHELGHKKETVERWLAKITLAPTFYGHFYIEHNRGHHVRVATPEDPASSKLGESFYAFWPRTVLGSLKSAWEVEARRYRRKGTHPFHIGNDVLNAWAMSVVLWGGIVAIFGWQVIPYALITILGGFSLLEIVNYLEHYGMCRQKVGPKQRYERVLPMHSWNSNNIVTNIFLYHLQRHSDHHANPTRRYQALRDFTESPALPTGYAGMINLALVPPLWRRVMDHRVVEHLEGDVTLANILPSKRAKYLAKFPPPQTHAQHEDLWLQNHEGEILAAKCPGCSYTYEVARGDEHQGFPAGTAWAEIPDDWFCPDCGVRDKADFIPFDPEKVEA